MLQLQASRKEKGTQDMFRFQKFPYKAVNHNEEDEKIDRNFYQIDVS